MGGDLNFAQEMVSRIMDAIYGGAFIKNVNDAMGIMEKTIQLVKTSTEGGGTLQSVYNAIAGVSYALVVLLLIIAIADSGVNGKLTFEYFVKLGARAIIACFLIANGLKIMLWFVQFGGLLTQQALGLYEKLVEDSVSYEYAKCAVISYVGNAGLGTLFGLILIAIIPWIMSYLVGIIIEFTILALTLELITRAVLAPIALADTFGDGLRPNAVMYLRKFAAVAVQIMCIIGLIFAFNFISGIVTRTDSTIAMIEDMLSQYDEADVEAARNIMQVSSLLDTITLEPTDFNETDKEEGLFDKDEIKEYEEGMSSSYDEQTTVAADLKAALELDGKYIFSNMFSIKTMIPYIALMATLILSVTKSRSLANMICGV